MKAEVLKLPIVRSSSGSKFVMSINWRLLGWCDACTDGMVDTWREKRKDIWKMLDCWLEVTGVS